MSTNQPPYLSLALSGGGARGIAHLGVLAALDELALPVGALAGASSGGIVGAFYAAGVAPREVLRLLALGHTAPQIGAELFLATQTIETHRRNLRHKLQAESQFELGQYARAFDLI